MDRGQSSSDASSEPLAKKARGRPRKSTAGSATDEEKRARGRQIQRAFQQRRQIEVSRLQHRVATLESTIEGMSNEFLNFGDRFVSDARETGDQRALDDVRRTTQRFLDLARKAGDAEYGSARNVDLAAPPITRSPRLELPPLIPSPFQFNSLFSTGIPNFNIPTGGSTVAQHTSFGPSEPILGSGRFSPRLNYGLFSNTWQLGPNLPPSTPWDNPWLSYLIAGPNSFASRLYVDCIELLVKSLKGEIKVPGFIPSSLRYRFRHQNPDSMMRTLARQLTRMNLSGHKGGGENETILATSASTIGPNFSNDLVSPTVVPRSLTPNSPSAVYISDSGLIIQGQDMPSATRPTEMLPVGEGEEALMMFNPTDYSRINEALSNLLVQIIRDVSLEGGTPGDWLDPWGVQQYISHEWGLRLNSRTIRPTSKTLRMLRGDSTLREHTRMAAAHNRPEETFSRYDDDSQWPVSSTRPQFHNDFSPILPPMASKSQPPPFPFQNRDPYFSERYTYTASNAPAAPPSHFLNNVPTLPSLLLGDPAAMNPIAHANGAYKAPRSSLLRPVDSYDQSNLNDSDSTTSKFQAHPEWPSTSSALVEKDIKKPILPPMLPATPLVTALILQAICFGEGPRFQRPMVDETVRNFLEAHSSVRLKI